MNTNQELWVAPGIRLEDVPKNPTLDYKIDIFSKRINGWKIDIANYLINGTISARSPFSAPIPFFFFWSESLFQEGINHNF